HETPSGRSRNERPSSRSTEPGSTTRGLTSVSARPSRPESSRPWGSSPHATTELPTARASRSEWVIRIELGSYQRPRDRGPVPDTLLGRIAVGREPGAQLRPLLVGLAEA